MTTAGSIVGSLDSFAPDLFYPTASISVTSNMQEIVSGPPVGKFTATQLRRIEYGPDSIEKLWEIIEDMMAAQGGNSKTHPKALVMTGTSLSKTPVVPRIEKLLQDHDAYTTTFTGMKQHAPISNIEEALELLRSNQANLIVGIGGGSVIDAAKLVSYFHDERHGSFIPHVSGDPCPTGCTRPGQKAWTLGQAFLAVCTESECTPDSMYTARKACQV